jgi:hypothetical protein
MPPTDIILGVAESIAGAIIYGAATYLYSKSKGHSRANHPRHAPAKYSLSSAASQKKCQLSDKIVASLLFIGIE